MSEFRKFSVVVADDDVAVCAVTHAILSQTPDLAPVELVRSGEDAISAVERHEPDVVIMDISMPGIGGEAATEVICHEHPRTHVLAHTGSIDGASVAHMIAAGATGYAVKGGSPDQLISAVRRVATRTAFVDDAAMPGLFEACTHLMQREREQRRKKEQMYDDIVSALIGALQLRDEYTGDHDHRVSERCVRVGEVIGLSGDELTDLEFGGMFHDIGKIGIPDRVLHKTGPLNDSEWDLIKQHTIIGEEILRPITFLSQAGKFVRHSHEHWDGSGYPDQLAGNDIPLESRIILACDAFDAMTTDRTYQKARSHDQALSTMRDLERVHFDRDVVQVLNEVIAAEPL